MSLVLAIEPGRAQADILREIHSGLGVQLLVVSSKDEAIEAIEREVPDLVLVNALLSPREENDLVSHLRTLENASHLQLLTIPLLGRSEHAAPAKKSSLFGFGKKKPAAAGPDACDPDAFAEQVTSYLARAREVKSRPRPRVAPPSAKVPPPPRVYEQAPAYEAAATAPVYEPPGTVPLYEPPATVPVYEPPAPATLESSLIRPPAEDAVVADVDGLLDRLGFAPDTSSFETKTLDAAPVHQAPADVPIESEVLIDLDGAQELETAGAAQLTTPEPLVSFEAAVIDDHASSFVAAPLADLAQIRAEAEATLATELERVQVEAAQQRERELAQWQAEAEAIREATVGRARAEAEEKAREALAAELARSRAEAEQARTNEIARLQAQADERLEEVTRQARQVAESEAARAFTEELARVRAEAEGAASRALHGEVSRVRAEADTRLQAELERVRREAEEARRVEQAAAQADAQCIRREAEEARRAEQAAAHAEAERIREVAAREARQIAEAAATRTLEAEVQRVRAEAEAVRAAAEKRLAEQSKAQADASHALAEAERVREAAAREAREIAEAAAARKLEAELQRVRAEADARLAAHNEAQLKAEKTREAAAREARLAAEAAANRTLETEIQRVRADADARLSRELSQLRADAEQRRAIELEEIRRQVDDMREAAAQQARSAATEAVAAEVARAAALRAASSPPPRTVSVVRAPAARAAVPRPAPIEPVPMADEPLAEQALEPAASYYDLWRAEGSPALASAEAAPWTRSMPSQFRQKRWMLPAAASVLLIVCGSVSVSVDTSAWGATARKALASAASALPDTSAKPEAAATTPEAPPTGNLLVETTPKGVKVSVDGTARGKTPVTVTNLSPGRHKVVLESTDGVVIRREVTIRAGERAVTSELMVTGWLTVYSRLPLEVHADGRRIGSSGDGQMMLSPGRHKMMFVNRQYNIRETRTIDIQAGSIASHNVKLPLGKLNVDAPAGAEVLVDGDRIGEAPLRGASVPVGTLDVLVRHPSFGERRHTIEVRQGTPATITIGPAESNEAGQSFDGLKVLSESAANPGIRKPVRPPR